ncbi:MAG: hypothetical protein AAF488_18150 [Planctomycetota bacterium]
MDRRLHVERWLLSLKSSLVETGLDARVRAWDRKGGELVSLLVFDRSDALEIRTRKLRLRSQLVVACTSPSLATRVADVAIDGLADHRRLLENGLRKFWRRAADLLIALSRTQSSTPVLTSGAHAAQVALHRNRQPQCYDGQYAADRGGRAFAAISGDQLRGLNELLGVDESRVAEKTPSAGQASEPFLSPLDGIDLFLLGAPLLTDDDSELATPAGTTVETVGHAAEGGTLAVNGAIDTTGDVAEAGLAAADIGLGGAADTASELAGSAGEAAAAAAEAAGEAISGTASALSDAACAGLDCGGLDCVPF